MPIGGTDFRLPYEMADLIEAVDQPLSTVGPGGGGMLVAIPVAIPDAATTTYTYTAKRKMHIVDVVVNKSGAGAANTIQVKNGAGTAISDAMAAAVDATITRAATIANATRSIAAGANFQITATRSAGTMAATVYIIAVIRP